MWTENELTRRLGIELPIVQGPFGGGLSTVDLLVAVCESGGLGSFGAHNLEAASIQEVAKAIRARTNRPFALNLWIPLLDNDDLQISDQQFADSVAPLRPWFEELHAPLPQRPKRFVPRYSEQVEAVLEARPAVFSFVFGIPSRDVLDRCHRLGIRTVGAATTVDEAVALDSAGVDMIVATGFEAGGHRVSFLRSAEDSLTGTMALVPQVVDAVKVPVIAAGGIADGRGIAAALILGAQAAQIGTAFLACEESAASALHRAELFSERARRTTLTCAFTGRLARGIHNRFIEKMKDSTPRFASYPVQAWLTAQLKTAALAAGRTDILSLWSGQSASLLRQHYARDLMRELREQVETTFAARA